MPRFVILLLVIVIVWSDPNRGLVVAQETKSVTYDDDVAAIFKRHCRQCHGESKKEAGLDLSSYAAVKKGSSGGPVVATRASASRLMELITAQDPAERMPPNNDRLPDDQIATMKAWIDSGLRENVRSAVATKAMSFKPRPMSPSENGPPPTPDKLPAIPQAPTVRPFSVLSLAASPRAALVAVSGYESISFLDPATRASLGSIAFPEGEPHVLRFSRSGAVLLAAGGRPVQSGAAVLFDVKSGKRLATLGDEVDTIIAADISPDERRIAFGGSGNSAKIFSTEDGKLNYSMRKHPDWITAIAFSPDGKLLATGDRSGNIHLWDPANGGLVLSLSEHKAAIRATVWRSDSKQLASCGEDGSIIWWDVTTGFPAISKTDAHPPRRPASMYGKIANGVLDATFGPSGELVTCGRDGTVKLWGEDGRPLKSFSIEEDAANETSTPGIRIIPIRVALTYDGQIIIAGDSAGRVHFWSNEPSNSK